MATKIEESILKNSSKNVQTYYANWIMMTFSFEGFTESDAVSTKLVEVDPTKWKELFYWGL